MADWFYPIVFVVREVHAAFMNVLGNRPLFEWFLFFCPFFLFGEFPRYTLPPIVLMVKKMFRLRPENRERLARFVATKPSVSILLVGYNEEETITAAIESLLQFDDPNLEIIVIVDG